MNKTGNNYFTYLRERLINTADAETGQLLPTLGQKYNMALYQYFVFTCRI